MAQQQLLALGLMLQLVQASARGSIPAVWNSLGRTGTYPHDNYTRYTFFYKAFEVMYVDKIHDVAKEVPKMCGGVGAVPVELQHLTWPLFQHHVMGNRSLMWVTYNCWDKETNKQNVDDPPQQPKRHSPRFYVVDGDGRMLVAEVKKQHSQLEWLDGREWYDFREFAPNLWLCVRLEDPYTTTPPTSTTTTPRQQQQLPCRYPGASSSSSSSSSGSSSRVVGDLALPLASVAFLAVLSLVLAAALLLVCRRGRRKRAPAPAGDSIPRTSSSLINFPEKGQAVSSQTLPRRPRVIHHGQLLTNGYHTLGSIQARKQREMQLHGVSQPPSPNYSIPRSDCRH